MDRYFLDKLPPGSRVKVYSGEPRPPARFNKKLAGWLCDNFIAVVDSVEEPSELDPFGRVVLAKEKFGLPGGCISFLWSLPVGPYKKRVDILEDDDGEFAKLVRPAGVSEEDYEAAL